MVSKIDMRTGINPGDPCPFKGMNSVRCRWGMMKIHSTVTNTHVNVALTNQHHRRRWFNMEYSTLNPSLQSAYNSSILGSLWERIEGFDLVDARKGVGDNLVNKPKMPTHIFLPAEMTAADMRAAERRDN